MEYAEDKECEMFSFTAENKGNIVNFYIFWDKELFGEFYVNTIKNIVYFIHGKEEVEYRLGENNMSRLQQMVNAFVTGYDEFEEII